MKLFSRTRIIKLPRLKDFWQKVSSALVDNGLTRRTFIDIEENAIKALGEAGLGHFSLRKIDDDHYELEARNDQALEIIGNLLEVELEREKGEQEQQGVQPDKPKIFCTKCNVECIESGRLILDNEGAARAYYCPLCKKMEFYYE